MPKCNLGPIRAKVPLITPFTMHACTRCKAILLRYVQWRSFLLQNSSLKALAKILFLWKTFPAATTPICTVAMRQRGRISNRKRRSQNQRDDLLYRLDYFFKKLLKYVRMNSWLRHPVICQAVARWNFPPGKLQNSMLPPERWILRKGLARSLT